MPAGRDEHCKLEELLGELRVMLSAVAVLFAFLLTVPLTARVGQLPRPGRVEQAA